MSDSALSFEPELPAHSTEIETINADAFGPGRFTRAAYRIREQGPHEQALSFVARSGEIVIGSVRLTRIVIGDCPALLLGPLAVRPEFKNQGIGRKLVSISVDAARASGARAVLLVGDAPYYRPLGFEQIDTGSVFLPGPVDPKRLLLVCLNGAEPSEFSGHVIHANRLGTVDR